VNNATPRAAWDALRTQWAERRVLRIGVVAIGAIVWLQVLFLVGDRTEALRRDEVSLRDELARVQLLAREKQWPQRAEDARTQLGALRSLLWNEPERGLAEASMQDWIRSTAAKSGLRLREVALVRAAASSASAAQGVQPVRLRVTADLDRLAVAGFLAELARHERAVLVETLVLRPAVQPPQAEMELRMPWQPGAAQETVR